MCLALPAEVIAILPDNRAKVNIGGIIKEIATDLVNQINEGDYVIIHVGYALTKLDENEAKKTLKIMDELGKMEDNL